MADPPGVFCSPEHVTKTKTREALTLFGDGLRLSDEPLESFLAALFLQFLPNHIPAGQVVIVEPVTLRGERKNNVASTITPLPKATWANGEAPCAEITTRGQRCTKPFPGLRDR